MDLDPGTGHDCANLDRPMMPEETLTLDELQTAKDTLEARRLPCARRCMLCMPALKQIGGRSSPIPRSN